MSAGSNQDMVQRNKALFDRQLELRDLHQQDDAKYEKLTRQNMKRYRQQQIEALTTLSKWGYEEYWLYVADQGKHTSNLILGSGASNVHGNETRNDYARITEPGERCKCDRYLEFGSMCEPRVNICQVLIFGETVLD
jgi:hypothetical protein